MITRCAQKVPFCEQNIACRDRKATFTFTSNSNVEGRLARIAWL
jgi:hypothetical protein